MINQIKLHHYPASRSARVRWALFETVGDDFETAIVELYKGEQFSDAYLNKNPNHHVPMLEITMNDGEVLRMIERAAMVEWLADAFPEKKLAPRPGLSLERADYLQMLHFASTWMDMMLWQVRIHEHVLPTAESDDRTIARYRKKMRTEAEPQLEARLEKTPFICGENFTAADIIVGHNVTWARGYQMCQSNVFKNYLSRISKRPAFQKAFADAHKFKPELPNRDHPKAQFSG